MHKPLMMMVISLEDIGLCLTVLRLHIVKVDRDSLIRVHREDDTRRNRNWKVLIE